MEACHAHPEVRARWRCSFCGLALCDDCVDVRSIKGGEVRACGDCGGRADPIAASAGAKAAEVPSDAPAPAPTAAHPPATAPAPTSEPAPPPSPAPTKAEPGDGPATPPADLGTEIVRALTWPFAKDALPLTLWAIAICFGMAMVVYMAPLEVLALLLELFVLPIFGRFLVEVVRSAQAGKDTLPHGGASVQQADMAACFLLEVISFGPWLVYGLWSTEYSLAWQVLLVAWAAASYTIGLLALAMSTGLTALDPRRLLPLIAKNIGGFLFVLLTSLAVYIVGIILLGLLFRMQFLAVMSWFMAIYFLTYYVRMVLARLLGRLYVRDPEAFAAFGG